MSALFDDKPRVEPLTGSEIAVLVITIIAFMIPAYLMLSPSPGGSYDILLYTHTKAGVRTGEENKRKHRAAAAAEKRARSREVEPAATEDNQTKPKLQSIHIYPVKSCRGIEVARSRVLPQGLEYDRLFMFAQLKSPFPLSLDSSEATQKEHKWEFITQRQFARLATVKVDLWLPDANKWRSKQLEIQRTRMELPLIEPTGYLVMRFPWSGEGWRGTLATVLTKFGRGWAAEVEKEIMIPLNFPTAAEIEKKGYVYEDVKIWKETITALNISIELPEELRLYLGVSNKLGLFRVDPNKLREVYRCAPREKEAGYQPVTGFQDAYPLHMITTDSVEQFSKDVPKDDELKQLDLGRFRANIILSGAPAYDEEMWKKARFKPGTSELHNDAVFHVSCRTVRCKMPNVDPVTGDRHPREPDHSLRTKRAVDAGAPNMGCLGMQLTPLFEDDAISASNSTSTSASEKIGDITTTSAGSGLLGDDGVDDGPSTWIAVGMTVDVEVRGEHLYVKQ